MTQFQKQLENKVNFKTLIKLIEKVGGNNKYNWVKRAYSRIISDEHAAKYNWLGLKNKKKFGSLLLARATIEASMKNRKIENVTEKSVESAIKSWLRHAADRLLKTRHGAE
ncbi:uncharacterized protein [Leptinotarsa decemlineata]|uniref:uncharacterized protein n=1 Tax=Leptinotarsa decemlineata TaxID=7539 RepID=UPI003D30C8D4